MPTRRVGIRASSPSPSFDLLEVEHVVVEVREDVPLEELLLAVEGELLGADGAYLPVALHVPLEAALLKVGREYHLTQRAALVDIRTVGGGRKEAFMSSLSLGIHLVRTTNFNLL